MKTVEIRDLKIGNDQPLTIIAGPCQLESRDHAFMIATKMQQACADAGAQFIFKGSFDKANRTSLSGKRGLGIDEGLRIFEAVQAEFGCPVITDVHTEDQCATVGEIVDVLQIPAFLCRQTDLLLAAGRTGRGVNVKKGQFLSPPEMSTVADKVASTGNEKILLCERGTTFGYNNLVADMRGLPTMARTGYPVVMDATHAVAQPGGLGASSGGQREFAPVLARAAVSLGIAAVFMETHEDPDNAPSDGPNMIYLDQMPKVVASLMAFDRLAKSDPLRV
ncbi:3-deoxy-8-phosphooctulonate synthase [Pontivivens nitratireducens]|uniref:3-deoxy-8-phosphooctulonate synthase n=1 Tax=Pontivivens nitratireducens TaxID=2758038 RepID=UPI00163A1C2B|nr:3-deoxy-8-phosphooctulonate synthase [Pontibrevibacter nitratireducens]